MTRYKYSVECNDLDQGEWTPTILDDLNAASELVTALDACTQIGSKFTGVPAHEHKIVWVKQDEDR